jgi:16S rRNA (cytosine1402-N4)-methyltransferase
MHIPVMLNKVIEYMNPKDKGIYLDATVGEGGHAGAILEASAPEGYVVCSDADDNMLNKAKDNLKAFRTRIKLLHANYRDIENIAKETGIEKFDGIIVDLGFNTAQINDAARGFSFSSEGPLDMRYDTSSGITAYDVVNKFDQERLAKIIKEYGEERQYKKIAKAIIAARKKSRIKSTTELASLISKTIIGRRGIHPATKTFQAIRIFVNDELENLKAFLQKAADFLDIGGVLIIISFHSLEDRVVKHAFRQLSILAKPVFKTLTRKPAIPDEEELRHNYRARSARLRAIKRIA